MGHSFSKSLLTKVNAPPLELEMKMVNKGVSSIEILKVLMWLPDEHPQRDSLIDCLNSAFKNRGILPDNKQAKYSEILNQLIRERAV